MSPWQHHQYLAVDVPMESITMGHPIRGQNWESLLDARIEILKLKNKQFCAIVCLGIIVLDFSSIKKKLNLCDKLETLLIYFLPKYITWVQKF